MFNIELIRQDLKGVKEKLRTRNFDVSKLDNLVELDIANRDLKTKVQTLLAEKNKLSKEIGTLLQQKNQTEAAQRQEQVKALKEQIESLESQQNDLQTRIIKVLEIIPNLCDDSVPVGKDDSDNVEIKK